MVEEEALDQGAAATHPHFVEGMREMFLDRVLGDVQGLGDLVGGGSLRHALHHRPLAVAQPVGGRPEPCQFLGARRLDDNHRLAAALGVSPSILGGTFTLSADNLVYDDATGEFEGVVTTKEIALEVEAVPAPPALMLLGVALVAHRLRRRFH